MKPINKMKKLQLLMVAFAATILTSQAQVAIKLNPVEQNFLKSVVPQMTKLIQAKGGEIPEGNEEKFGSLLIKELRGGKVFNMTPEDELLIKDNGKVESFARDLAFWKAMAPKVAGLKGKKGIFMRAFSSYCSGLTEKSPVVDQLMIQKFTKGMKGMNKGAAKTREIMKSKQVFMTALQYHADKDAWPKYADLKIDESMKFIDPASGKVMDWVMHLGANGEPKEAYIVSPRPWKEFYIITMKDGATRAVPLKEAKEKYGIGE